MARKKQTIEKVVLTKDEFVERVMRDLKKRKEKKRLEELEHYGELDDLDYLMTSSELIKVDIDEMIKEALLEYEAKPKAKPKKKVSKTSKAKKSDNSFDDIITKVEFNAICRKDGNEQLCFVV